MRPAHLLLAIVVLCAAPAFSQGTRKSSAPATPPPTAAPATAPTAVPQRPDAAPGSGTGVMEAKGPQRIDFDDRLVQGQTNKLGAVYLYSRKAPAQPSLLVRRNTFREEIARDLLE